MMRAPRRTVGLPGLLGLFGLALVVAAPATAATASAELEPLRGTIGDALALTVRVELADGESLRATELGPELGPYTVLEGAWDPAPAEGDAAARIRTWSGTVAAYETGRQELPALELAVTRAGDEGAATIVRTEPVVAEIVSVLDPAELEAGEGELADIKPPASIAPDYGPVWTALLLVAALGAAALLLRWLQRRYAARLAAAAAPVDPFQRTPPHVWVFAELQRLLDRRLPEQGLVDEFYDELSRIAKQYLGARYRVDLIERTTEEVGPALGESGTPVDAVAETMALLRTCDRVKFARERPGEPAWREAIERIYGIVDRTKPADAAESAARPAAREGAA